jgi:hypothetical protein
VSPLPTKTYQCSQKSSEYFRNIKSAPPGRSTAGTLRHCLIQQTLLVPHRHRKFTLLPKLTTIDPLKSFANSIVDENSIVFGYTCRQFKVQMPALMNHRHLYLLIG